MLHLFEKGKERALRSLRPSKEAKPEEADLSFFVLSSEERLTSEEEEQNVMINAATKI